MAGNALRGVLVTFKRADYLGLTLNRLSDQRRRLDTLVIVDNDPSASARDLVEAHISAGHTDVQYVAPGANLGPAGGIALGMRHAVAEATDDDWVVLLDDDDPPRTPDMLGILEEFGTSLRATDRSIAAVGKSGTRFDLRRARVVRVPDEALSGAVPSNCIGGNHLPFISVHAIRAVGVFDERLFFGFEELDYGLRLWAAGFRVFVHGELWYEDRAHYRRLDLDAEPDRGLSEPSWRRYYSVRNLNYILRKNGRHAAALRLAARSIGKPIYNLPRNPALALSHLRLASRAVIDAYLGRMGRTMEPAPKQPHAVDTRDLIR